MDRITLSNFHEQIDSLKSTSIPQVKRYFRKRIVRCINECKLQAINMKKAVETVNANKDECADANEYEFGWGSDFDDMDDDEEEDENQNQPSDSQDPILDSIAHLDLKDSSKSATNSNTDSHQSSPSSPSANVSTGVKRPATEPPPPPLPKHPPPNLIDDCLLNAPLRKSINEDTYEMMSASGDISLDDEYLLPNSSIKSNNSNYEYIEYNQFENCSSGSRTNLKIDLDAPNERPLPPVPYQESTESLSRFTWFHTIERDDAEKVLRKIGLDGAYLVRKSRRAGLSAPYTLTLFYNQRIFHLNIRKRSDELYALGKDKHKEKTFASVAELIKYHNDEPIFLTSKGVSAGKTQLIYTPSVIK